MKATTNKHVIWTNDIDINDWRDDIKEWYPDENLTDYEIYCLAYQENEDNLENEKGNLNKELGADLVMIATLGLCKGWRHIKGSNLNDIFQGTCGDYITWYVNEDGDIRCEDTHHDGTNYYTYRALKDDISPWEFDELMAEGADIDELTVKLGHHVAEIYGW